MTTLDLPAVPSKPAPGWTLPDGLWYQPWFDSGESLLKLQRIWLESMNDAMRHETEFLVALTVASSRMTRCLLGLEDSMRSPASMAACYQEIAGDMTEATLRRMRKVSELSEEVRERLWCEM